MIGIGAIIGAGIFATVGTAAAGDAASTGRRSLVDVVVSASPPLCARLQLFVTPKWRRWCPISGSAYTYSYATMGELVAWIIGWDLILEYAIGNVAVAISWANYFRSFIHDAIGSRYSAVAVD